MPTGFEDYLSPPGAPLLRDPGDQRIGGLPGCSGSRLLGVPWDWSITGRPGPRYAPSRIRSYLYSLTPHSPGYGRIACRPGDLGDVRVAPGDWSSTRPRIRGVLEALLGDGFRVYMVGGDHSISGPGLEALASVEGGASLLLLDHHYDLRSTSEGLTSGSWLYEALKSVRVEALIVGVGDYSNPGYLAERAKSLGVRVIPRSTLLEGLEPALEAIDKLSGPLYVSVDMDHLDQAYAPGVNAPGVMGMAPWETWSILTHVLRQAKVRVLDVVEVNPLVDVGDSTSRLAAKLLAHAFNLVEGG